MLANLESAVKSRNETSVKRVLQDKPRLNSPEGGKILWYAVLDDEVEIASMLVRAGANLRVRKPKDVLEKTFLHVLVSSLDPRHHRLAVLMMDYGADVNTLDRHANAILCHAIRAHHSAIELVKELLARGARVSWTEIAETAGHPLAIELLPLLIEAGNVDENTRNERAQMALQSLIIYHRVSESEILPAVEKLLEMKLHLEMNYRSFVVLFEVVARNEIKTAQLLIAHGFDVKIKLNNGYSLLHVASKSGSIDMIKLLVRHGADFNSIDDNRNTPLSYMPYKGYLNDKHQFAIKQFAILFVKGCDINDVDLKIIEGIPDMKNFYEQSQQELKFMQLMTVLNGITFFSVLSTDLRYLTFLCRNHHFVQSYKDSPRKSDFPIFYNDLEEVFNDAEERKKELLEKELALCEKLGETLPYVPLEKIILNLYMNDLEN